jgi:hypothetical protein
LPSPEAGDAYLDPGTGAVILQMGIAAAVGGLLAVKLFWGRIRGFLKSLPTRTRRREAAED